MGQIGGGSRSCAACRQGSGRMGSHCPCSCFHQSGVERSSGKDVCGRGVAGEQKGGQAEHWGMGGQSLRRASRKVARVMWRGGATVGGGGWLGRITRRGAGRQGRGKDVQYFFSSTSFSWVPGQLGEEREPKGRRASELSKGRWGSSPWVLWVPTYPCNDWVK